MKLVGIWFLFVCIERFWQIKLKCIIVNDKRGLKVYVNRLGCVFYDLQL